MDTEVNMDGKVFIVEKNDGDDAQLPPGSTFHFKQVDGEISATYNAAVTAGEQFPDRDIVVIDSRTVSMAQGLMVLEAAKAAQEGADKEQIVARATDLGKRSHVFAALATLKYLALSGRVGSLAAGMANLSVAC